MGCIQCGSTDLIVTDASQSAGWEVTCRTCSHIWLSVLLVREGDSRNLSPSPSPSRTFPRRLEYDATLERLRRL